MARGNLWFRTRDWLAWFTIAKLTDRLITIYGNKKQVSNMLYLQEHVKAFDSFLNSKVKHEVFNIGGGPENTLFLLELIDLLRKLTGKAPKLIFVEWRSADQKVYVSDISKMKRILRWEPQVTAHKGVRRLVHFVYSNLTRSTTNH